jgi:FkbM family methyltransferase
MPISRTSEKINPTDQEEIEIILGHLYRFLPKAFLSPNGSKYFRFVNSLREKIFTTGEKDIRSAEWMTGTIFKTDLSERYGCEFHYGYFQERLEAYLFRELLAPGSIVIDVGANFGLYTILSAQAVSPTGRVYAFEPVERAFNLLEENVRINALAGVATCYNFCIGASDGQTEFYITEDTAFSGMAFTERSRLLQTKDVQVRSIDSFLHEVGQSSINALKIDVEGFEYAVLAGAMDTIRNSPEIAILLEISSKNLTSERKANLLSTLENIFMLGFQAWCTDVNPNELRVYSSCADLVDLPSAAAFLVRAGSAREKDLLRAHSKVINSLTVETSADVTQSLGVALGEEVFNLIEKLQTRYDVVQTRLQKAQRKLNELDELRETHRRWERASFLNLIRFRYGDDIKRILAPLRNLLKRG